jgi:Cu/Ag efflux protein CusF
VSSGGCSADFERPYQGRNFIEGDGKVRVGWLRLALPLIVCGLAAGDAAEVQETGADGLFYGRGLVKAVEPGTGWVTLAHNDIMGCMPAMEMMFRVRAPDVSRNLRPGDTIDFTLDGGDYVILDAKLVSHAK